MLLFGLEFQGDILRWCIKCPPSCAQPNPAFGTTLQLYKHQPTTPHTCSIHWHMPSVRWIGSLHHLVNYTSTNSQNQWFFLKCIQLLKTFARVVRDAFMSIQTWHVEKCPFASSDGAANGFVRCMSRSYSSRWNRSFLPIVPARQALHRQQRHGGKSRIVLD